MRAHPAIHALLIVLACELSGCASHYAYRTNVIAADAPTAPKCSVDQFGDTDSRCANVTPEIVKESVTPGIVRDIYELHFVEFDDQGWLFPDPPNADPQKPTDQHPSMQIDKLMDRLNQLLSQGEDLKIILFVHGWKHNADTHDDNVKDFRLLLERAAADELYHDGSYGKPRKVIGIYVGWRGKPWLVPDPVLDLSFWSRKDAAARVAVGSVRELFARLRTLHRYYNMARFNDDPTGAPRIRTLMIGHSFGGLIIYAATSSPLIEVLTARQDLPPEQPGEHRYSSASKEHYEEANRVADMIVLVNPAFEASRFEALYRVAQNRAPDAGYEAPMLVSITSDTDYATGAAFPVGRFVNTLFERPTSSDEQATAIKQTPGHMENYLTHRLSKPAPSAGPDAICPGWRDGGYVKTLKGDALVNAMKSNKAYEDAQSRKFKALLDAQNPRAPSWTRDFCGGAHLSVEQRSGSANATTLAWNILAGKEIIDGHGDVMNPALLDFVRQLFGDTDLRPATATSSAP